MFVETVAFGPGAWDTLPRVVKQTFIGNALTWLDELQDPGWPVIDLEVLRRFDRPSLVTNGTESAPFFAPIAERIAAVLPRARSRTCPKTGHVPHVTSPDVYLQALLPFLREVTSSVTRA